MAIQSENWAEVLDPGIREIFDQHTKREANYIPVLFGVRTSRKAHEDVLGIGQLGEMEEWNASGKQVAYEDFSKGFDYRFSHKKYSKGLQIEQDLIDDDQYDEVRSRVELLSFSVFNTRQTCAASVFNNAFNASFKGPDDKPLCSASHPVSPGSSTTNDNHDTVALTASNLETARNNMKAWKDDKGNLIPVEPDTLLVPPGLRKTALIIADSEGEPDTSDNNVNVWKGALRVIEWPKLTSATAWFFIDSKRMKTFLRWFDRKVPRLKYVGLDEDTEIAKWKVVGRWSYGWKDWSFVYGSTGTG